MKADRFASFKIDSFSEGIFSHAQVFECECAVNHIEQYGGRGDLHGAPGLVLRINAFGVHINTLETRFIAKRVPVLVCPPPGELCSLSSCLLQYCRPVLSMKRSLCLFRPKAELCAQYVRCHTFSTQAIRKVSILYLFSFQY